MKKIIFIITIGMYFLLDGVGSSNKFGIEVERYKEQITALPNYFGYNENTNKYSWFTPIILPDSNISIELEHLVVANQTDIQMIPEIQNRRFLLTVVSFKHLGNTIESIHITNTINDEKLPSIAYYLYRNAKEKDHRWDLEKIPSPDKLRDYDHIRGLSIIYPFPENASLTWLNTTKGIFDDAEQVLEIVYLNAHHTKQTVTYHFHLDYYLFMSIWDKIVTIT